MIAVSRFDVAEADGESFAVRAGAALAAFGARPGYRRGSAGRSFDEPTRWVMVTEWEGVGTYRRALSSYDVKVNGVPLLAESIDEPGAYEVLVSEGIRAPSDRAGG
ncbi:MAG: hypothetical protein WCB04_14825 [Mycobacteriales bacterium]